jgi:hypothetical protein
MTKRSIMRQRRQQARRRNVLIVTVGVVAIGLSLIGFSIYQTTRPIGPITPVAKESLPFADGKALGQAEASVLVQEFSDFQ